MIDPSAITVHCSCGAGIDMALPGWKQSLRHELRVPCQLCGQTWRCVLNWHDGAVRFEATVPGLMTESEYQAASLTELRRDFHERADEALRKVMDGNPEAAALAQARMGAIGDSVTTVIADPLGTLSRCKAKLYNERDLVRRAMWEEIIACIEALMQACDGNYAQCARCQATFRPARVPRLCGACRADVKASKDLEPGSVRGPAAEPGSGISPQEVEAYGAAWSEKVDELERQLKVAREALRPFALAWLDHGDKEPWADNRVTGAAFRAAGEAYGGKR